MPDLTRFLRCTMGAIVKIPPACTPVSYDWDKRKSRINFAVIIDSPPLQS